MREGDPRRRALRDEFEKARGYWSDVWNDLLDLDPDYFEAYLNLSAVPWRRQDGLSPKLRELIYIAIDASTTHLYAPGTRIHMERALAHGATREDILEVLQLTSVLGVHSCTIGVPILMEELALAGRSVMDEGPLTAEQEAMKAAFVESRGVWNDLWEGMLRLSPDYFEAFQEFAAVPWQTGPLSPRDKTFIYIAIDAAATHLYQPGIRNHVRKALEFGATAREIMEVFELISVLGIHTFTESLPILREVSEAGGATGEKATNI